MVRETQTMIDALQNNQTPEVIPNNQTSTPVTPSNLTDRSEIYPGIAISSCRRLPEQEYVNLTLVDRTTQRELIAKYDANTEFCVDKSTQSSPHVYIPKYNHACMFQYCIEWLNPPPIKVVDTYGNVICWDISLLEHPVLNANNQNFNIINLVKRAKQIGSPRDFYYCVREDNTTPHLYIPTEYRTCLPSEDDNCYSNKNQE